jgi:hypothetical protein
MIDTRKLDCNNHTIYEKDVIIVKYDNGSFNGKYDVGVVCYDINNCQFYISCFCGEEIEFKECSYIEYKDSLYKHPDKTGYEVLKIWEGELYKYE